MESLTPGDGSPLLSLPFDHYQRYHLTQRIVSLLWPRQKDHPLRILDVGGHSSSLKHFLPNELVILTDPLAPPSFSHREEIPFLCDAYLRASGVQLPFADADFDLACAHDTLEHVPDQDRQAFLQELLRVARHFVVLNGPIYRPETARLEKRMSLFARRAISWENPYLREHLDLGLPHKEFIEGMLQELGLPFAVIPNGVLSLWVTMMAIRHYLMAFPHSEPLLEAMDRTYNAMLSPQDLGGLCYREAYVISKDRKDAEKLRALEATFVSLASGSPLPDSDFAPLETLLSGMEEHARLSRRDLREASEMHRHMEILERTTADLRSTLADKDALVTEKDSLLTEKDSLLTEKDSLLDSLLTEKDALLAKRDAALEEGESHLREREEALQQVTQELITIRQSLGYRLLEAYRRRIRWLFPPGSRRALPYRALVKAARWLLHKRPWRHPWSHIVARWRRFARLARRSIRVIRTEGWKAFWRKARRRLRQRPAGSLQRVLSIDYQDWITRNEPDPGDLTEQRAMASKLPYRPLISIIVPTWNPPLDSLRQTIDSVLAQTYDDWELCIADGGSRESAVREMLAGFAARDGRIRVKLLKQNFGISRNSNETLALATGEFVAFLDHTDLLAPFALFEVAQLLNRDPGLDCIYSDMDLISEDGRSRFSPLFKPEWSPDMMLSANYPGHLEVIRKALVDDLGGLRSATDGAQDWDLLLRISERTDRFARIPKILYHWRSDSTSAAVSPDNKPYARAAQERAVQEYLIRRGLPGHVVRDKHGELRVRWQVTGQTRVSIVIPTKHSRRLLKRCLRSIDQSAYRNWEILVVETAGRTRAREAWYRRLQAEIPLRVLWWEEPFSFSAVNNLAAGQAEGDALLFLNDDTEALAPDWLDELVGWLEQPGIGVVGAQLLAKDGTIQHGGDIVGLEGFAAHLFTGAAENEWTPLGSTRWYRNLVAVTGACLLVRKGVFEAAGGFDENFGLCGSDVELCLRIRRAGYRIVCTPFARVMHRERATRGSYDSAEDCFTSFWPYETYLHRGDPYFNPNLSSFSSVPQLRHPEEPSPLAVIAPVLGRDITPYRQRTERMAEETGWLVEACQLSPQATEATRELHRANGAYLRIKSINWFIPDFESPFYGGIHTILRFAAHFQRHYGVKNRFIVLGTGPEPYIRSGLKAAFPELGEAEIRVCSLSEVGLETVPEADASIATLWTTAYAVSKFDRTKRKFYFIQDFEPVFYPAGSLYALAEASYRMGLYGIANSPPLKEIYESSYGGKAVAFTPCVDTSIFYSRPEPRRSDEPFTVFFYGRPGHWRNCHELAMAALRRLKDRLGKRVRIVAAGSWVSADDPDSNYLLDQKGLVDYRETASLYRTCDAALVLSVSKHPSYLPLELMACGVLVVSNVNPAASWLLRDGENCLLAEPTAENLCQALERALLDQGLRERLRTQALADIRERHSDWEGEMETVFRFLCDPGP